MIDSRKVEECEMFAALCNTQDAGVCHALASAIPMDIINKYKKYFIKCEK